MHDANMKLEDVKKTSINLNFELFKLEFIYFRRPT